MTYEAVTKPVLHKTAETKVAGQSEGRNFVSPLVIITAVFVLANIAWSFFDHGLPDWDAAGHVLNGLQYRDLLKHPHLNSDWLYQFLSVNYLYPPALYILNGTVKLILGIAPWVDALIKAFYQALLCVSVYGISKRLLKDKLAATMAVVFINFYPQNSFLSHQLMLDFPTLAMVALALWSLIVWQETPSIKNTFLLGLAIGYACMTKQLAGAFIMAPAALVFLNTLTGKRFENTAKLLAAAIIPAAMSLPWLLVTYPSLQKLAQYNTHAIGQKGMTLGFGWVLSTYLSALPSMMTPILLAGFIASLLIASTKTHRSLILVSASSIGGLILISTLSWAYPLDRYAMPALIAPAIYTAYAFSYAWSNRKSIFLRVCFVVLALVGALQFLLVNYAPYPLYVPSVVTRALPAIGIGLKSFHDFQIPTIPEKDDWGQIWILTQIRQADKELPVYLHIMPNSRELNVHTFQYAGKLVNSPVIPTTMRQWAVTGDSIEFSPQKAMYYHWYLLKTGDQGNIFADTKSRKAFDDLTNFVRTSGKFRLMAMRSLPDHSICYLYRQK